MRAFAASQGAASWGEMGTFTTGGGPSGSGMLLEDGLSFLLEEDNDYLILEQA
jgi:hypothetical protein